MQINEHIKENMSKKSTFWSTVRSESSFKKMTASEATTPAKWLTQK